MSTKIVNPLDLDRVLGNTKNRIAMLGVELEGGWRQLPAGIEGLERDTSVFNNVAQPGHLIGELPIGPFQPAALARQMRKYYPHKVDATCGMHVHMSFDSMIHYGSLMVPEYQETLLDYLTRWAKKEGFEAKHHIWPRLAGKHEYCKKEFWPDAQANYKGKDHDRNRHGHRYTAVHYCGRNITIEVRVLPMMQTVEQAVHGVKAVLDITNACLVVLARKVEKTRDKVEINGWAYEEDIEVQVPLTRGERVRMSGW